MAIQKISTLSVGDWVRVINQFDAQIDGYHSESGSLSLKTRQRNLVHYRLEDVSSIPITPKILEANGFEKIRENVYFDPYYWTNKKDTMIEMSHYKETYNVKIVQLVDGLQKDRFCDLGILFVHQLQHILRLAGVDKEIVMPNK